MTTLRRIIHHLVHKIWFSFDKSSIFAIKIIYINYMHLKHDKVYSFKFFFLIINNSYKKLHGSKPYNKYILHRIASQQILNSSLHEDNNIFDLFYSEFF